MDNFLGEEYNISELVMGTYFGMTLIFDEDITGWSFAASILSEDRKTVLKSFSISVETAMRQVTLSLTENETAALPQGTHFWEFIVTDTSGKPQRWLHGKAPVIFRKV